MPKPRMSMVRPNGTFFVECKETGESWTGPAAGIIRTISRLYVDNTKMMLYPKHTLTITAVPDASTAVPDA